MENQLLTLIDERDYDELLYTLCSCFHYDNGFVPRWCINYITTRLNNIANISQQELLALPFVIDACKKCYTVSTEDLLIIANVIASRYNYSTISTERNLYDAVDHFYFLSIEDEKVVPVSDSLTVLQCIIDERNNDYEI